MTKPELDPLKNRSTNRVCELLGKVRAIQPANMMPLKWSS